MKTSTAGARPRVSPSPSPAVDYSQSWAMKSYRLMGTKQRCTTCGAARKGAVASEVYVVCQHVKEPNKVMSVKLTEVIERYMAYTGLTADQVKQNYLPGLPVKVVWAEVEIAQCPECVQLLSVDGTYPLPPMLPLAQGEARGASWPTSGNISITGEAIAVKGLQSQQSRGSRRAKPREKKSFTMASLLDALT